MQQWFRDRPILAALLMLLSTPFVAPIFLAGAAVAVAWGILCELCRVVLRLNDWLSD